MNKKKDWASELFSNIRRWTPGEVAKERLAWVKVTGVLVHAWTVFSFSLLVEKLGRFIKIDEDTLNMNRLDAGFVLILTGVDSKIDQSMEIKIGDSMFKTRIMEVELLTGSNMGLSRLMEEEEDPESEEEFVGGGNERLEAMSGWGDSSCREEEEDDVEPSFSRLVASLQGDGVTSKKVSLKEKRNRKKSVKKKKAFAVRKDKKLVPFFIEEAKSRNESVEEEDLSYRVPCFSKENRIKNGPLVNEIIEASTPTILCKKKGKIGLDKKPLVKQAKALNYPCVKKHHGKEVCVAEGDNEGNGPLGHELSDIPIIIFFLKGCWK
ncbi:unnamed protein product [Lupinus luteus]|uniref:DUF4283 domain-containing protein n=1 Tax=Lupinus luteus TaxID=3873 RepID=A0AAV1Y751_LUPLU